MTTYSIPSNNVRGRNYDVTENGGVWGCGCVAGGMGKTCVHIRRAQHMKEHGQEQTVNEHLVQISKALCPVEVPLLMGDEVYLLSRAVVTDILEKDNHDGTYNRIAKVTALETKKIDATKDGRGE